MDSYFDTYNLFDRPHTSSQTPSNYPLKPQHTSHLAYSASGPSANNNHANQPPIFDASNFRQFDQYPFGFAYDPGPIDSNSSAYFSPNTHTASRTPSLCGDVPQEADSPNPSPPLTKEESPGSADSPSEYATPHRSLRKRGRPRIDQSNNPDANANAHANAKPTTPSSRNQRSGRLPHNQVERKYREGINAELERLRKAVPSLLHYDDTAGAGQPKPSKAMVLSSAIEYINLVERERDALKHEIERLKQGLPSPPPSCHHAQPLQASSPPPNQAWKNDRSLDDFLMDA